MATRRDPTPLSYDDVGRAAYLLARLPELGHGALAALAWTTVNMWRRIHADEAGVKFPVSMVAGHMIELGEADVLSSARPVAAIKWRMVAAMASALARDGDDPTGGAISFHHGSSAPNWALDGGEARWIGPWAFYR